MFITACQFSPSVPPTGFSPLASKEDKQIHSYLEPPVTIHGATATAAFLRGGSISGSNRSAVLDHRISPRVTHLGNTELDVRPPVLVCSELVGFRPMVHYCSSFPQENYDLQVQTW